MRKWIFGECCLGCKSNTGIVYDIVAGKISCSECGFQSGLDDCGISFATTTEPKKPSSDEAMITAMSDRLGLLAKVKNRAIGICEQTKDQEIEGGRDVRLAACIYVACRQNKIALKISEISSAANGANTEVLSNAVISIARKLGILSASIQTLIADYAKRFCSTLRMDNQVVKAAQEAAESYARCPISISGSPVSLAAVVVYVIARISYEKKLLKDLVKVTGLHEDMILRTYKDLHPHLSEITPGWFANAKDLKRLDSP